MIEAKHISVSLESHPVLDNVSVQIPLGQVTVILGPNGAGKSTLLKTLTGLVPANKGIVEMNQKRLSEYSLAALSQQRAVLSQSAPLSFPFTVKEVVKMGRAPFSSDKQVENTDVISSALTCVEGLHLMNRVFPTLSGGEQQRVQLARVLAQLWGNEKSYLFLDEPTSALDLKHQHQVLNLVSKLAHDKKMGVCIVMHDLHLARRYANQAVLLKDGRLFAAGDVNAVLSTNNIATVFEVEPALLNS